MNKIIIDTDPGIDDALAICYALAHPQLDVLALTCIFGNVSVQLATANALRLCELTGITTSVAKGADVPLQITPHPVADFVHGANGFGDVSLPDPSTSADPRSAAQLIVDLVREQPGEISLVPVGPLTNIALALEIAPDIAGKVKEVIVMGGVFFREGNVSKFAEANVWNDPHAAKSVLTASWPVTVHGLDATYQINFSRSYLAELTSQSPVCGGFLEQASDFYIKFYNSNHGFDGCCPHDLLAVSYAANPEWFDGPVGTIDVVTEGEEIGRTTLVKEESAAAPERLNKKVITRVEAEKLLADYQAIVSTLA